MALKQHSQKPALVRERGHRLELFRWLVGFAATALDASRPSTLTAVPDRLLAAAQVAGAVLPATVVPRRLHTMGRRRVHGPYFSTDGYLMGLWTTADTVRLHRQLAAVLNALLPSGAPAPESTSGWAYVPARLGRLYLRRHEGRVRRAYVAADSLLWFGIAELLEEFGGLLVRCSAPGCDRIFARQRRQAYCSPTCSQKVRSATWYRRHRAQAAKARRLRYAQDVRARLPGAKVRPRRRVGDE
jgi:hypothetical protein